MQFNAKAEKQKQKMESEQRRQAYFEAQRKLEKEAKKDESAATLTEKKSGWCVVL